MINCFAPGYSVSIYQSAGIHVQACFFPSKQNKFFGNDDPQATQNAYSTADQKVSRERKAIIT